MYRIDNTWYHLTIVSTGIEKWLFSTEYCFCTVLVLCAYFSNDSYTAPLDIYSVYSFEWLKNNVLTSGKEDASLYCEFKCALYNV